MTRTTPPAPPADPSSASDAAGGRAAAPPVHPLDAALVLQREGDGIATGHTSPAYANMIGPFGGITAATLVQAMRTHPACLGEPLALTVNYAGPVADGAFTVLAEPLRTNRSTQHWRAELRQDGQVAVSATAVFGVRRETWASTEIGFPAVPAAEAVLVVPPMGRVAWTRQYEMRFVSGGFPDFAQGRADADATTTLWMRDEPPRPLDFASLTALCDVFFPRIYLRRRQWTPAGTVSMTIYFHADAPMLAAHGAQPVLGVARAQRFGKGFFDQSAEVWAHDGALLATTHQIVYYKE